MMQKLITLIVILFSFQNNSYSQTCQDVSVELTAVVQSNPGLITLNWVANAAANSHVVFRKLKTASSWGTFVASLPGTTTQYIDSTVAVGVSYEYQIIRTGTGFSGYGYINSGILIPATEQRGSLILLVDSSFASPLSPEITRLQKDLEGDGWKVITHTISRTASVPSVKSIIAADYNNDPTNTKALFLLGHIPVPYSGDLNPDGHPDHEGAWPADVFYGDMNGTWTDASINVSVASDPRNINIAGDGKYDQSMVPGNVSLQIGRVDFANMPAFVSSEQQLLQNYLNKDHDYRNKVFTAVHRAVIDDNFGYFGGEAFAASGWRNASPLVGTANVSANDYFTTMTGNSYLWSYGCGGGTYTSAGGVGATTDFTTSNLQGVFSMLFGSYFGDWDSQNNFLRAPLAQGTTLTNVWAGRPHWVFHHMGLGENIGYDVKVTQSNNSLYSYNYGGRFVHIALMGDPTLRNDIIAPVSNVVATSTGTNAIISWTASADTVLGYNIYMKNDSTTNYERINSTPITGTTYTDMCLLYPGVYTYMVRAVVCQVSPSGSYYNMSEGISDTTWNNNYLAININATYTIAGNAVTFTNTSTNATSYEWIFGDGNTSTFASPVHTYPSGNYNTLLIATNGCNTDTLVIYIPLSAGINELRTNDISIFPNPTTGKFQLTTNNSPSTPITISNTLGEIILEVKDLKSNFEIDLSNQPKGIYFLRIGNINRKIIKQ